MDSPQKRTASSSSSTASSEPPQKAARSSSRAERSSWCTQCWKHPDDKCSGDKHRVLPLEDAKLEARKALDDTHRAWEAQQERLAAVEEAGEPTVLELSIPEGMGDEGQYLEEGSMMIRMAVTGALNEEEKENVIEAMKEQKMLFELELDTNEKEVAARGSVNASRMASVIQKLPLCVDGQKLPACTVLCYPDEKSLEVYDKPCSIGKAQVRRKVRVFGRVTNDFSLRAFRNECCDYFMKGDAPSEDPVEIEIEDVQFVD